MKQQKPHRIDKMIQIYKPNAKNTGCAISLRASDRDDALFLDMIRQFSWDPQRMKGSFAENRNKREFHTTIKFSQVEAGRWLDAIERFVPFEAFHGTEVRKTVISFALPEGENPTAFLFKISQTQAEDTTQKASFFIPIDFGEARLIKEYLIHFLHKSFKMAAAMRNAPRERTNQYSQPRQATADETPAPESEQQTVTPTEEDGTNW